MSLNIQESYNESEKRWNIMLRGEVDIVTAQDLRETLKEKYEERKSDFCLDLEGLNYIDSTGLGVIIGAYGRMQDQGNKISVKNPKENVAKLLRITNLDKILCE